MSDRMEVVAWRKSQSGKPYAVRLGSAVPKREGPGFMLYLDAMPAAENGQYVLTIQPQRPRENSRPSDTAEDVPF